MKRNIDHFLLTIAIFIILLIFYGLEDAIIIIAGFYICLLSYTFTVRNDRKKHKRTTSSFLPGFYEHPSSKFESLLPISASKMWKSFFSRKDSYSLNNKDSSSTKAVNRSAGKENIFCQKRSPNESKPFSKFVSTPDSHSRNDSFHKPGRTYLRSHTSTPVLAAAGPLLSAPILPNVKRAIETKQNVSSNVSNDGNRSYMYGCNESFAQDTSFSRNRSLNRSASLYVPNHPASPSPGIVPHVRLYKQRPRLLSEEKSSMFRRSNTVKIAPPDPVRSANTSITLQSSTPDNPETPLDSQSVLTALKDKRKRSQLVQDELFSEVPTQQAKRRRQESSESTTSTCSSLPPLPDNLPDLSLNGINFSEQQSSLSLKRPALFTDDWDPTPNQSAKKQKNGSVLNSIVSSLSSSKRAIQKESLKRRCSYDNSRSRSVTPKFPRSETPVSLTSISESEPLGLYEKEDIDPPEIQEKRPQTPPYAETELIEPEPIKVINVVDDHNDTESRTDSKTVFDTKKKEEEEELRKLLPEKRISLKRSHISINSPMNKLFKKVPSANVLALPEDYQKDREVELERVHQMLSDIDKSEKQDVSDSSLPTSSAVSTSTTNLKITPASTSLFTSSAGSLTVSSQPVMPIAKLTGVTNISQQEKDKTQPAGTALASGPTQSDVKATVPSPSSSYSFKPVFGVPAHPVTTVSSSSTSTSSGVGISGFSFPVSNPTSNTVSSIATANLTASRSLSVATTVNSSISSANTPGNGLMSANNLTLSMNQNPQITNSVSITTNPSTSVTPGFSISSSGLSTTSISLPVTSSTFPSLATPQATGATVSSIGKAPVMNFFAQSNVTQSGSTSITPVPQFNVASNVSNIANSSVSQSMQASTPASVSFPSSGFQFGQSSNTQVSLISSLTVAPPATTTVVGNTFQFGGAGTQSSGTVTSTPSFQFGQSSAQQSTPSLTPFGQVANQQPSLSQAVPSATPFGQVTTQQPSMSQAAPGATPFGQVTTQQTSTSQAAPSATPFGQGVTQQSTSNLAIFGQGSGSLSQGVNQQSTPATLQFGQSTVQQSATGGLQFGKGISQQPAPVVSQFGQSAKQQTAPATFQFGAASNQPASAAPVFGHGFSQPTPAISSQATAPSTTGGTFGTASISGFQFGQSRQNSQAAPSTFQFSQGTTSSVSTGFQFGQAITSQAPTNNAFQFAASSSTQNSTTSSTLPQTPIFGQSDPSSGFNFNSSGKNGNSSIAKNLFGGTTTSTKSTTSSKNLFGAPQTQSATSFGQATSNQTSGQSSTFGQTNNTTPAFGPQATNSSSFNFGQNPAPVFSSNNNSNATQTTAAPGVFSFGNGAGNQATTPSNKGFNFNAGTTNGPQFNFAGTAPNTNFATPSGQNNSFSLGTGSIATKGRVVTKARRKGGKK